MGWFPMPRHAIEQQGEICIELNLEHQFVLIVIDNRTGFPEKLDFQNTESVRVATE